MLFLKTKNKIRGFTVIELLIVIGIIGLLSTLAVVSFSVNGDKAEDVKRMYNVQLLRKAIDRYIVETNNPAYRFPNSKYWYSNSANGFKAQIEPFLGMPLFSTNDPDESVYFYCRNQENSKFLVGVILKENIDIPSDIDGWSVSYTTEDPPYDNCVTSYPGAGNVEIVYSGVYCDDSNRGLFKLSNGADYSNSTVFCLGSL
jgi:prepilin-type N-terminal cleavage/methylation domain-containing protein